MQHPVADHVTPEYLDGLKYRELQAVARLLNVTPLNQRRHDLSAAILKIVIMQPVAEEEEEVETSLDTAGELEPMEPLLDRVGEPEPTEAVPEPAETLLDRAGEPEPTEEVDLEKVEVFLRVGGKAAEASLDSIDEPESVEPESAEPELAEPKKVETEEGEQALAKETAQLLGDDTDQDTEEESEVAVGVDMTPDERHQVSVDFGVAGNLLGGHSSSIDEGEREEEEALERPASEAIASPEIDIPAAKEDASRDSTVDEGDEDVLAVEEAIAGPVAAGKAITDPVAAEEATTDPVAANKATADPVARSVDEGQGPDGARSLAETDDNPPNDSAGGAPAVVETDDNPTDSADGLSAVAETDDNPPTDSAGGLSAVAETDDASNDASRVPVATTPSASQHGLESGETALDQSPVRVESAPAVVLAPTFVARRLIPAVLSHVADQYTGQQKLVESVSVDRFGRRVCRYRDSRNKVHFTKTWRLDLQQESC
jgi:hypothetical protein